MVESRHKLTFGGFRNSESLPFLCYKHNSTELTLINSKFL